MDKDCVCKGLDIFRRMVILTGECGEEVDYLSDDLKKDSLEVGFEVYHHLMAQVNKPENKDIYQEAMKRMEIARDNNSEFQTEGKGTRVLDEMVNALHQTPILRRLMVCSSSPEAEILIQESCDYMFEARGNPSIKILPKIYELTKKLGCKPKNPYE